MRSKYYKEILNKVIEDKLTKVEQKELSEDKAIVQYMEKIWDKTPDIINNGEKQKKRIWKKIAHQCWGNNQKESGKMSLNLKFIYAAAAFVAIILVGTWVYQLSQPDYITLFAPKGTTLLSQILPDSSVIWLNSETTVRYNKNFIKQPIVYLDGEAFFDVRKKGQNTFKIFFKDACIEVKGTTFNIKSYKEALDEVTLFTGKIDFSLEKSDKIHSMNPSEQIIYNSRTRTVSHSQIISSDFDWRTGVFKFKEKRFEELIEDVNRIYNVNIIINRDSHKEYPSFNGTIRRDESLTDVLDKICFSLNMKTQKKGDCIILY
jgi:Fe2+-dicitrate sensor, membrane component